jgi:magnesium chelatase family protein
VSGPLLDRIDIAVRMPRISPAQLISGEEPEPSTVVRERIAAAREIALRRNGGVPNARIPGARVLVAGGAGAAARARLQTVAIEGALSGRSIHRVLRVARTIADLGGREVVEEADVLAAVNLREDVVPRQLAA